MSSSPAFEVADPWRSLCESWRDCNDYLSLVTLCRKLKKISDRPGAPASIALLGAASTDLLIAPLQLALSVAGVRPEIHVAGYDQILPELLDPASETSRLAPAIAILVLTPLGIQQWPETDASLERANEVASAVVSSILDPCRVFHERTGSEIVLNNFHAYPIRMYGNLEARLPGGRDNFIRRVNLMLADSAPPYVHIHDVCGLAERKGVDQWFDLRDWHDSKQPVAADSIPEFVRGTAAIVAAILGRVYKCAVLDLDNTLWHGVIGDDGVEGIQIGHGSAAGEAFLAFQHYLKAIQSRGILLAVCSKNQEKAAELPFLHHPDMVLKRDDFVAFRANWLPKSENIRSIAAELNIGLDSIVFIDDNPAERYEVRRALPEVAVPELTLEPSDYPGIVARGRYFESVRITDDDRKRTETYALRSQASALASQTTDYPAYLRSLEMEAVMRPFDPESMDRVTQLINKSNQFNLTTRRLTLTQVRQLAENPGWWTRYIRLSDRFGDHGLIGVLTAEFVGDQMFIRDWLMSCRVLSRTVEALVCNELVAAAREAGSTEIVATYIPTAKNALVKNLCRDLGFTMGTETEQETTWHLSVKEAGPWETFIRRV